MHRNLSVILLLLISSFFHVTHAFAIQQQDKPFLPILLMHGITAGPGAMNDLKKFIQQSAPANTLVISVPSENYTTSVLQPMVNQLKDFTQKVNMLKQQYGFTDHHLICHSQGGLLCRTYVQTAADHNVKVFISLSGVQNGQFGIPEGKSWEDLFTKYLPFIWNFAIDNVYVILYNQFIQESVSFSNYWRDPYHMPEFRQFNQFLAIMNNDTGTTDPAALYKFRDNTLRIDKMVLTGSPQDEVIKPYNSAFFEFYHYNTASNSLEMRPMEQQAIYLNDVFGLKTLNQQNRLIRLSVPNVTHMDWIEREDLYNTYMKPYLY